MLLLATIPNEVPGGPWNSPSPLWQGQGPGQPKYKILIQIAAILFLDYKNETFLEA